VIEFTALFFVFVADTSTIFRMPHISRYQVNGTGRLQHSPAARMPTYCLSTAKQRIWLRKTLPILYIY